MRNGKYVVVKPADKKPKSKAATSEPEPAREPEPEPEPEPKPVAEVAKEVDPDDDPTLSEQEKKAIRRAKEKARSPLLLFVCCPVRDLFPWTRCAYRRRIESGSKLRGQQLKRCSRRKQARMTHSTVASRLRRQQRLPLQRRRRRRRPPRLQQRQRQHQQRRLQLPATPPLLLQQQSRRASRPAPLKMSASWVRGRLAGKPITTSAGLIRTARWCVFCLDLTALPAVAQRTPTSAAAHCISNCVVQRSA